MFKKIILLICSICIILAYSVNPKSNYINDNYVHNIPKSLHPENINEEENQATYWTTQAQNTIKAKLQQQLNTNIAKNVIMFLGDGMSVPTVTAARIYVGGESNQLSFDKFPHTAMSKTYCVDHQVPDSACTSTAYLTGVKANTGTIGVTGNVLLDDCVAMLNATNHVDSIGGWFQAYNKSAGFVTTTRVTHASPAGLYAHTAERNWESDSDVLASNQNPSTCLDIAAQLVTQKVGQELKVILGGGRSKFLPENDPSGEGERKDGINLINEWLKLRSGRKQAAEYVTDRKSLFQVSNQTDYLFGLFNQDHISYNLDRDLEVEPSLEEMTEAAIKVLQKDENGFFLFVEGGKIDLAHHDAKARKALDETAELSKAVAKAVELTGDDTLIVVTSDHAHTLSISGYPDRGNDILGLEGQLASDGLPYTTINYANGPGYRPEENGKRYDLSKEDLTDKETLYSGIFPMDVETHGGDDVIIFASGPWSHLFNGVIEQNVIPHIMAFASCTNVELSACSSL